MSDERESKETILERYRRGASSAVLELGLLAEIRDELAEIRTVVNAFYEARFGR